MSTAARSNPWLLAGPGTILFTAFVILPLALTLVISFQQFEPNAATGSGFTVAN